MSRRNKKITNKVKVLVVLILIFLLAKIISYTFALFESNSNSTANLEIAYYILEEDYQSMNINLGSLLPREEPYIYSFSIANNNGENRLETNMQYDLKIRTTTNLPLQFELYKNEEYETSGSQDIINSTKTELDEYNTYFTTYTTPISYFGYESDEKNVYQLVVYFPSMYNSIDYQDVIENVEIIIESKQIV